MSSKNHADELKKELLEKISEMIKNGSTVSKAITAAEISKDTYYKWKKEFGGLTKKSRRYKKSPKLLELAIPEQAQADHIALFIGNPKAIKSIYDSIFGDAK